MPSSRKRAGSVAYSLVMFVIVSVLSGVLVAGLFVPVAAMAGLGSRTAAHELEALPAELATPAPPTRSRVLMADGRTLAYFYDENRVPVTLDQIAPVMRQAQLAIEDHRFYEHGALDIKGTVRALVRNTTSDSGTQGGSSITQQYVKMVQVEACAGEPACVRRAQAPTVERKIRELRYAIALEKQLTKDQILERYLNIAYYGDGAYGVQAAAKHYFGTDAKGLTLPQAAMLAGLVQNPDTNNPVRNRSGALDRRDVVLNRMAELGIITTDQARRAKKVGFDEDGVQPARSGCVGSRYPFLCDYVRRSLLQMPSLGKTEDERRDLLNRGGLTIQTAIDPEIQDLAEKKVADVVGPTDPLISTMNMIQPGTGLIVAMAQSRPEMGSDKKKGETYWNLAVDPAMGGIQGYQAGSTFKAFTMAAALEKGIPITQKYNARSPFNFTGRRYETCTGHWRVPKYVVRNAVGHSHTIDMTEAAEYSVNTYFIQLELATGLCRVTKMAKKLGVKVGNGRDLVKFYQTVPAFTLGSVEVSPLSMAEAYATFAARGKHCNPVIVSAVTNRDGQQLQVPDAGCQQVLDPEVADGVNQVLKSVMDHGTGRRAKVDNGYDMAGKTGTIDSNEAVWFAGYTPDITGVAMISIDNTRKPFIKGKAGFRRSGVKRFQVPSTGVQLEGSGSGDAGMKIWKPVMEEYLKTVPGTPFDAPSQEVRVGKQVRVPQLHGMTISRATKELEGAGFTVQRRYVYSSAPRYSFLGWSERGGASVPQSSTIYATYSRGRDPAVVRAERQAAQRAAEARREALARWRAAEAARERARAEEQQQAAEQRKAAEREKKKAEEKPTSDGTQAGGTDNPGSGADKPGSGGNQPGSGGNNRRNGG